VYVCRRQRLQQSFKQLDVTNGDGKYFLPGNDISQTLSPGTIFFAVLTSALKTVPLMVPLLKFASSILKL